MAFSASDAAFEGFRLARRSPMAIVLWAVAYVIFTAICFVAVGGSFIALMAAATELQGVAEPSMEALQPLMAAYAGMVWILPLGLVFSAIMYAAVNRAVLTPADNRFGYLRLGMDEVRVFVVTLVLTILAIVAGAIIFGVAGVIAGFGGAAAGDAAGIVVFVVILAAIVLSVWLALRLSLAVPITMARKKIAIFDSWSVTRGRALGLLGMTVIAVVMTFVVSILASIIILPVMFFAGGGIAELMAMETTDLTQIMTAMGPAVIIYLIYNALVSALTVAILYAPYAAAYRDISGAGETLAQAEATH
jgi:hypothetical protein